MGEQAACIPCLGSSARLVFNRTKASAYCGEAAVAVSVHVVEWLGLSSASRGKFL